MTAPAIAAAAGRARIGVITNPNSRRNLSGFAEMARLLDGASNAHHAVLEKITDIPDILDRFANDGIDVVAVAGGDGTVQAVLTEIYGRRPFQRVPMLAVLPRGTTNMTAADIGLPRQGDKDVLGSIARLLAASPAELEAAVTVRRVLRAENALNRAPQYGMFFGGAGICRAIEACRTQVHPLKLGADLTAAVMLAGVLGGWLLGRRRGAGQGGIFYGDRITVTLDDGPAETMEALVILATTLDRLILRSRPFWGEAGGHLRFTAIAYPPQQLLRHAWRILYGGAQRKLPAANYRSRASDRVALAMDCPFTLDGEIFQPTPGRALILTAADEARFVRL